MSFLEAVILYGYVYCMGENLIWAGRNFCPISATCVCSIYIEQEEICDFTQ